MYVERAPPEDQGALALLLQRIRSMTYRTCKTDQFLNGDCEDRIWVEDRSSSFETQQLREHGHSKRWVQVGVNRRPDDPLVDRSELERRLLHEGAQHDDDRPCAHGRLGRVPPQAARNVGPHAPPAA